MQTHTRARCVSVFCLVERQLEEGLVILYLRRLGCQHDGELTLLRLHWIVLDLIRFEISRIRLPKTEDKIRQSNPIVYNAIQSNKNQ